LGAQVFYLKRKRSAGRKDKELTTQQRERYRRGPTLISLSEKGERFRKPRKRDKELLREYLVLLE